MRVLGSKGEDLAADYYQSLGFKIIARNFIFPKGKQVGELDLVCIQGRQLVFVEVKLRRNNAFGTAEEAVDYYKRLKLVKMAKLYMLTHPEYDGYEYRIDVAKIDIDNREKPVTILVNAIEDFE